MSNPYASPSDLANLYDVRPFTQLSNDTNSLTGDLTRINALLDMQAAELESHLNGRVGLPLTTVSAVLTKWVCVKTGERLWGRRNDRPKELDADVSWADKWIEMFDQRMVSLPSVAWANQPQHLPTPPGLPYQCTDGIDII